MLILVTGIALITFAVACNKKPKQAQGPKTNPQHQLEVFSGAPTLRRSNVKEGMKSVELNNLTPPQKELALKLLNEVPCACGCRNTTVAECRVSVTDCSEGEQQAVFILDQVKSGKAEAAVIREMYSQTYSRMARRNMGSLFDSIGSDKDKDFMVAQLASTIAGIDVSGLKKSSDELADARAVAALFLGKERQDLLPYLEGVPDELYIIHGVTWQLLPRQVRPMFEYYLFRHRPELQQKVLPYLNPTVPSSEMMMITALDIFTHEPPPTGFEVSPGSSPSKGNANAPIVLVEYSDFECPYSKKVQETVKKVMDAYPGMVRHVYKNFPLPFHKNARLAAQAALAAGKQGKFWEMHDKIFDNQAGLSQERLEEIARQLGLDVEKFKADLNGASIAKTVQTDQDEAIKIGVQSTPTIIVNGTLISGAQSFCVFKEIIDEMLKK
jgi:protein-disulfide isomerase